MQTKAIAGAQLNITVSGRFSQVELKQLKIERTLITFFMGSCSGI